MKARQFDDQFEKSRDIIDSLDLSRAARIRQVQKRVNIDLPTWMIERLDKEANRMGATRQSIIKVWLAEKLEQVSSKGSLQTDQHSVGD